MSVNPSNYLPTKADLDEYGVSLATQTQVMRASLLVDHYLRRPEGLIWGADGGGQAAYMVAKAPLLSYTATAPILAGHLVVVPLTNYSGGDLDSLLGESVMLDRLNPSLSEACIVQSTQPGQVTLDTVQFSHSVGASIEFGMCVTEQLNMPNQRSVTRLSEWPVVKLLGGIGRYGYGRRTDQNLGYFYDANLLATLSAFGGPPAWVAFSVPASSLNVETGDLWVPAGTLLAYYTEVKIRYVCGWQASNLPPQIKLATAAIVEALQAAPMGPQIRRFQAGKLQIERFADTVLDQDIKDMLRPYMANWMI